MNSSWSAFRFFGVIIKCVIIPDVVCLDFIDTGRIGFWDASADFPRADRWGGIKSCCAETWMALCCRSFAVLSANESSGSGGSYPRSARLLTCCCVFCFRGTDMMGLSSFIITAAWVVPLAAVSSCMHPTWWQQHVWGGGAWHRPAARCAERLTLRGHKKPNKRI